MLRYTLLSFLSVVTTTASFAAELLPPDRPPHEVIDHYIAALIEAESAGTSEQAEDSNLLRRTMFDLVGRPPTVVEVKAYLADEEDDKRMKLVERLMQSRGYVRHQVDEFDALLMYGSGKNLRDYLTRAFDEQRPWDQMFRELMLGEKDDPEQKGALQFVNTRVRDLDKLTNETSVMFFGVNVTCAKCHDHPEVGEWTQDRFYGMKSFFNRTFESGGLVGERDYGLVSFKTTSGEEKSAKLMFLNGTVLSEPPSKDPTDDEKKAEKKLLEERKKNKQPPPAPKFSRREQLVEVALTSTEDNYFAKAIVNKIWYRLLGRGLVMPIDQMHPANPASHPELLEWLARDLVSHNYDLSRLVKAIVMSEVYSRSSQFEGDELPSPELFAVGSIRTLTPAQYAVSLKFGSTNPDEFIRERTPEELEKHLEGIKNSARGYARQFEQPTAGFQIGVNEALLISNDDRFRNDFLRDAGNTLVGKLKQIDDVNELINTAVWNVMGRPPAADERDTLTTFYKQRAARKVEACQQLTWALLTSAENRFNY